MRRLEVLAQAAADLRSISRYITLQRGSREIGRGFSGQLLRQCRHLASLPGTLGRARPELGPDIRTYAFRGYVIVFRYAGDRFQVVNVLEGHRDIDALFQDDN